MAIQQAHILVADDHPEVIQEVLPAYGYQITVVNDGRQAMGILDTQCQEFDLMLLDIMMPFVNGWDILRHLRGLPDCQHMPVIMITALESEMDQVSGLKIGADDYIVKPFKIPNLLARIEALLRRSKWRHERLGQRSFPFESKEPIQPITDREREILSLVAKGLSNKEIAEQLVVSELTVKTHLKNLFKKLNVSSRTQAILVGMSHDLIGLGSPS